MTGRSTCFLEEAMMPGFGSLGEAQLSEVLDQISRRPVASTVKAKLRDDRKVATRPNETWAMDFVHDQLATGRKIRMLTVVDIFSRYSPASLRGSVTVARTSCRLWSKSAPRSAIRRPFVSTRARSSSRVISICGLCQWRNAGLLTTRQADRQCIHRGLQRALPRGVPEPALVHEP